MILSATVVAAQIQPIQKRIAVVKFDPLGIGDEPVARLEALFRAELARLSGKSIPSQLAVAQAAKGSRTLRKCAGQDACLVLLGQKLGVDLIVSGNVAGLGNSFVVNIKAIDIHTKKRIRRIEATLRGNKDELIIAVRTAAYRLLAPEKLLGSIMILTDLSGATIKVDGVVRAMTPLKRAIDKLPIGEHVVRVEAKGYAPFEKRVLVRFQKTSRVSVRLAPGAERNISSRPIAQKSRHGRWYTSTWFFIGAGVTAAILGGYVGYKVGKDPIQKCPEQCAQ